MVSLDRCLSERRAAPISRHQAHQSGPAHRRHSGAAHPDHLGVGTGAWCVQLPYSHHQRKKRLFRFLSNTAFDTVAVQTALLGPICQAARLRGLTPIMIDWSDLGQGRNGLFAAVCFRGRGTAPAQLGSHAGRVEPVSEPRGRILHRSAVAPPAPPTSDHCCWRTAASGAPV